jgi:hypothetical protein
LEDLGYNLISVDKLADKDITSIFRAETVELNIYPKTHILGRGIPDHKDSSLYVLPSPKQYEHTLVSVNNKEDIGTWHKRMAHMNLHDLCQAQKYSDVRKKMMWSMTGFAPRVVKGMLPNCRRGSCEHADEVGDIIHSDMAGKLPTSFSDRYQYITTFTDDNSRCTSVAFMHLKIQLPQAFTAFRRELQVLAKRKLERGEIHKSNNDEFKIEIAGIRIVRVHGDGGKEFENLERLEDHPATYSAPYTPENNPISERGNRPLFDAAKDVAN